MSVSKTFLRTFDFAMRTWCKRKFAFVRQENDTQRLTQAALTGKASLFYKLYMCLVNFGAVARNDAKTKETKVANVSQWGVIIFVVKI